MKHAKIFVSVSFLIFLLFTTVLPVIAAPVPEDEIKTINIFTEGGKSGKSIDSCSFEDPVWEFPSVYQGAMVYGIESLGPNQTTAEVIIPDGVEYLDESFSGFSALEKAVLPSTLTRIYDYSFYECGALSEISLPEGLLSIGDRAFCKCTSLRSMNIPDSVMEIGNNAFSGCSSLEEVEIGSGIKTIGLYTFRDCVNLESVILSDGLETIGDEAFFNTSIRTLTLPGSIKRLGARAFNFEKLEKIIYEGTKAEFEAIVNYAFESAYKAKITVECTDGALIYNDSPGKDTTETTVASSDPGSNTAPETTGKDTTETTVASSDPGSNTAPETAGKTESPAEESSSPDSASGIAIAGVAACVVICGGVTVFLLVRRRKK